MPIVPSEFRPAFGLGHPHVQTIFPRFHRRRPLVIKRTREELTLPDGDELLLDHHDPAVESPGPRTLIIHGLSGSSSSHYVIGLQLALASRGWPSTAMNCRGAARPNRKLRAYHAGAGDDIAAVLAHLPTDRPLALVGFSLGGCMGLHAMMQTTRVAMACVVSVPFDFPKCADRMRTGLSRIYNRVLLKELVAQFQAKAINLAEIDTEGRFRIDACLGSRQFADFWEFDDRVVAPLHGFAGVHDYYAKCDPRPLLAKLTVPTLVIHAKDDPFMTPDVVPREAQLAPCVTLELSPRGGHVGFIAGNFFNPVYHLERRIPAFLKESFLAG